MTFTTVIKLMTNIKDKNILQKIILCDVQKDIYPEIEKALLNLFILLAIQILNLRKKLILRNFITRNLIKKIFFSESLRYFYVFVFLFIRFNNLFKI